MNLVQFFHDHNRPTDKNRDRPSVKVIIRMVEQVRYACVLLAGPQVADFGIWIMLCALCKRSIFFIYALGAAIKL